jgi:hypothetical protein
MGTGTFTIKTISADASGTVQVLDASFSQQCPSSVGTTWVQGEIRYNAPPPTPVLLTSTNPETVAGEPVTLNAFVDDLGAGTPTGSVTFFDSGNPLATVPVDGDGTAIFRTSSLSTGQHTLTARYLGDPNHPAATSSPVQQQIDSNTSSYYFVSQAYDWVGNGATASYIPTSPTTMMLSGTPLDLKFTVTTSTENWTVEMAAPVPGVLLPGVTYNNAVMPAGRGSSPGLDVSGDGRGCDTATGSFTINKLVIGPSGGIAIFDATYTFHCEGLSPDSSGVVKYVSPS